MFIKKVKNLVRSVVPLLMALCIFSACVPVAYANGTTEEPTATEVVEETPEVTEDIGTEETGDTSTETPEETEEAVPVEGEITDAQFKSYVLGCLFFFVAVIVFYFGYKFFAMFF